MLPSRMQQSEDDMQQVCTRLLATDRAGWRDAAGSGCPAAGSLPQIVLISVMQQAEGAMQGTPSFSGDPGKAKSLPGILRSRLGSPRRAVCMLCIVAVILQQPVPALIVLLG